MFNLYQLIYTNNSSNSLIQNPQIQTQPLVYPFILPGHNQGLSYSNGDFKWAKKR